MNNSEHTPGPWRSANYDDWNVSCDLHGTSYYVAIGQANGRPVCFAVAHSPSLFDTASSDAELDANASLIAAAPDLLAELQHALRFWDQLGPADAARMQAVINKATGIAE